MTARLPTISWLPAFGVGLICVLTGLLAGVNPAFAIVVSLGISFVLLTFADLGAGVVILTLAAFAESSPLGGPVLSFAKIVGLLLALSWLAYVTTRTSGREQILFTAHPVASFLVVGLASWAAISVAWAPSTPEGISEALGVILIAILYVIVFTAVRSRGRASWVIGAFILGAAGTAAYGLVAPPAVDVANEERLSSTIADPNALAQSLIAGLALATAAVMAARGQPLLRLGAGLAIVLCLSAFLLTGSRGGLVALGVALVVAIMVAGRWRVPAFLATVVFALATLLYFPLFASPEVRDRVTAATQGEVEDESRVTIWTVGWRMATDNAVSGVGIGGFKEASLGYVLEPGVLSRTDRIIERPAGAHNTYLQAFAELGIVGVALLAAIIGFSITCALRAARAFEAIDDWRMELLARGLIVAIAGVVAANFFIGELTGKLPWLLFALGPALLAIARTSQADAQSDS